MKINKLHFQRTEKRYILAKFKKKNNIRKGLNYFFAVYIFWLLSRILGSNLPIIYVPSKNHIFQGSVISYRLLVIIFVSSYEVQDLLVVTGKMILRKNQQAFSSFASCLVSGVRVHFSCKKTECDCCIFRFGRESNRFGA